MEREATARRNTAMNNTLRSQDECDDEGNDNQDNGEEEEEEE
jgi:hypothetical protein